jgi:Carboxypeptidase regulatory-like domain/TonB dependent receptor/TonB-dependent Receptor Plug Domain
MLGWSQTASTGALIGQVLDPSGRRIAKASIEARNKDMAIIRSTLSDEEGRFVLPLLPPGTYLVAVTKDGYAQAQSTSVQVAVTESVRLSIPMKVAGITEQVDVRVNVSQLQVDTVALGRVVSGETIQALPLAARNFTQIVDLSPGVLTGVNNAGELGTGGSGLAQIDPGNDGIFVHGSRSYDNAYELDGVPVTDVQASNIASGGIPIPNPDSIQEFKVQTGLYDVSFGERAGASVSLVTKPGTNGIHGSVFEYLRNNVLNANDYFRNRASQPRPDLKQNQFGFAVGGPILRDRLYYFGSYQGTRQTNGLASGQARIACSANVVLPPLTNDRSASALGALFSGTTGAFGGVAIQADGSNINPVALEILNFKLPNGSYLIPTPQVIDRALPLASQGLSTISTPCHYDEDQVLANLDFTPSKNSSLAIRFMGSDGAMNVTFPGNGLNGTGNISGFPSSIDNRFRVFSASWTRLLQPELLNQLRFGYTNTLGSTSAQAPFAWSDLGVAAGAMNNENGLPSLGIVGSINLATAFPRSFDQERFYVSDTLTYSRSRNFLQIGASLSRLRDDVNIIGLGSLAEFLSWPDFLLGLNSTQNGTNLFSNVYASIDDFGLLNRSYRSWNGSLFLGDHLRATSSLTLDLGVRYERIGQFNDSLGRNSSFAVNLADPNPPSAGSVTGYIVSNNYSGALPPGVLRTSNDSANYGVGQNGLAPRIGFAWQPSKWASRLVIRGGYGMYFSQPTEQAFFQSVFGAPYSLGRENIGLSNAPATFSQPFPEPFPTPGSFPYFPAYSPTSDVAISIASPDFRPAVIQQYGLNSQVELAKDWVLEIGYVGTRGTHLLRDRSPNQALSASPEDPIRGATSNTVANIDLRVPVQGVPPESFDAVESEGTSWYNGLEVSLNKQFSNGFQMLASYTFSKTLDSDGSNINGSSAGNTLTLGNQNSPAQRWGRASFDRTHRFILSGVYMFPSPSGRLVRAFFGGWSTSGVLTLQSGVALTIAYDNLTNVFGISEDRAQLAPGCNKSAIVTPGSVESKLNNYFNKSCFTTPPIIGADGIGTAFGDSATGVVDGPGQFNIDFSVQRNVSLAWPKEGMSLQFRADFFDALNHPQFANPNTTYGSSSFGVISNESVNPRIVQLGIKLIF